MALRIGGAKPTAPPVEEEQLPVEEVAPVEEDLMSELPTELGEEPVSGGSVSPMLVNYMDGQQRMNAMCANCRHFGDDGSCEIISGPIDPEGICNIYESMPEEAPMPEEPPMEEPAPVEEPMPEPEIASEEMA